MASETATTAGASAAPAPVITDTKRINAPFLVSPPDENGNRELSFIIGPAELETFVLSPQGRDEMIKGLSSGLEKANAADIAAVASTKRE